MRSIVARMIAVSLSREQKAGGSRVWLLRSKSAATRHWLFRPTHQNATPQNRVGCMPSRARLRIPALMGHQQVPSDFLPRGQGVGLQLP